VSAENPAPTPRRRGRPPACPPEVAIRVIRLHRQELSYSAIGAILNAEGIPTPDGRPSWRKFHVEHLLFTLHVRKLAEELKDS